MFKNSSKVGASDRTSACPALMEQISLLIRIRICTVHLIRLNGQLFYLSGKKKCNSPVLEN